jgi:hypothetical protein
MASDNLRDRIAAVMGKHWAGTSGYDCKCGWKTAPVRALSDDYEKHLADAVIEALATTYVSREAMMAEIQSYAADHENLDLADSAQDLIDTAAEWDQWK